MSQSNTENDTNKFKLDSIPHEVLSKQLIMFFNDAKQSAPPKPLTLTALSLFLNIPLKEFLLYPENGQHSSLITNAKLRCENDLVERIYNGKIDQTTGSLFLKNHFGYINMAKAMSAEERKKERQASLGTKRSISDILDEIENKKDENN